MDARIKCHIIHNHSLLVPTDLTLTTDRLTELFRSVGDSGGQRRRRPPSLLRRRYDIGGYLGLPQSALEEIWESYQSNTKCKEAYLDTYIHHHPCPLWKKISEVLTRCMLDEQASEVNNTYIQGMQCVHTVKIIE